MYKVGKEHEPVDRELRRMRQGIIRPAEFHFRSKIKLSHPIS